MVCRLGGIPGGWIALRAGETFDPIPIPKPKPFPAPPPVEYELPIEGEPGCDSGIPPDAVFGDPHGPDDPEEKNDPVVGLELTSKPSLCEPAPPLEVAEEVPNGWNPVVGDGERKRRSFASLRPVEIGIWLMFEERAEGRRAEGTIENAEDRADFIIEDL